MVSKNAKYKDTTELAYLEGEIKLMVSEWIPFGLNNIISLNDKLEADSEFKHTIITDTIDFEPETSTIETLPSLSRIKVVESNRTEFLEFISDILYKHSENVKQKEQIGTHVDKSGRVTYGMKILESCSTEEKHSLDSLSRIIADVVEDSSKLMDSVLNNYQKRLLHLVHSESSKQREKYVVVAAKSLKPDVKNIEDYLKDPALNSELSQIINKSTSAFTLEDGSCFISGESGLIILSDNINRFKHILVLFPLLNSIKTFQSNVFARMEMTMDNMNHIRSRITENRYESIGKILEEITILSGNVIMFEAIFSFIEESIQGISKQLKEKVNLNHYELAFLEHSDNEVVLDIIRARVDDAKFIVDGLEKEITSLEELSSTIHEKELKNVFAALRENTAHSVGIGEALEVLEAGIFGIYVIEFLNIAMETSGLYEDDPIGGALFFPLAFWIVTIGGLLGVYAGWRLLQRIKRRTIEKARNRFT